MSRGRSAEREKYWRSVLLQQRKSGQSVRQFCLANEITEAAFYNWRRRLIPAGLPTRNRSSVGAEPSDRGAEPSPFIPLNIPALVGRGSVIELVHPRGHVVRVPASFDGESLERLLNILDRTAG